MQPLLSWAGGGRESLPVKAAESCRWTNLEFKPQYEKKRKPSQMDVALDHWVGVYILKTESEMHVAPRIFSMDVLICLSV